MQQPKTMPCVEHRVGNIVIVSWKDEVDKIDVSRWHRYKIIGSWPEMRMILLEGLPEDDGNSQFTGGPVWVPIESIFVMEVE